MKAKIIYFDEEGETVKRDKLVEMWFVTDVPGRGICVQLPNEKHVNLNLLIKEKDIKALLKAEPKQIR